MNKTFKAIAIIFGVFATTAVIASIVGQQVRSNSIRKSICEAVIYDQLKIQNDGRAKKLINKCRVQSDMKITKQPVLIPNVNPEAKYKKKYGKFDIEYTFKWEGYFSEGEAIVIRKVDIFTKNNGQELKGKYTWSLDKFNPNMDTIQVPVETKKVLLEELEEHLNEYWVGNGNGSYISAGHYKVSNFSLKKEMKELHETYNDDEDMGYEHIVEEISVDSIIDGYWFDGDSTVAGMIDPLKSNILGAVVVYPDDSEGACDESEYCSYIYYYIFFDDKVTGDTVILEINMDATT